MFGADDSEKAATLRQMQYEAIRKCNFNQAEARNEVVRMVANDRRFDSYDSTKLTDEVYRCAESGRRLNWDDASLRKTSQPQAQGRRFHG